MYLNHRRTRTIRTGMIVLAGVALGWRAVRRTRFDLEDKRVLVMGGSRGLGLLLVREFLRQGARVVFTARDPDELARASDALDHMTMTAPDGSRRFQAATCDVSFRADVERAIEDARAFLGGIDVLVNNAGIIQVGPLESMRIEDFESAMRVHFHGPLAGALAVKDEMAARRSGRIVNISSIGGLVPIPHLLPYSASKFALTGLSEGLRAELAKSGVLVTTVCPGLMRTGSSYRALFKSRHRREHAWFALGTATPLTSMNARRAARQIVRACRMGQPLVILSWQAKLLAQLHAIAPNLMLHLLSAVARLLPSFGGIAEGMLEGRESGSMAAPSPITRLDDRAAQRNNEL